jgi:hypothetical protein
VASPFYYQPPVPPGLYRLARALRRLSTILLVLLVVFVAIVAYSAVQIVKAKPSLASPTTQFEPNDTIGLTTTFGLNNPTFFPIQQFLLHFEIQNGTGTALVDSSAGPETIAAGATDVLPIQLYLPVSASDTDLLTQDQYLDWSVWGNASYAYLFTVSVEVQTQRSWGAPFDDLAVVLGTPFVANGVEEIPVTVSFTDNAEFADEGMLDYQVVPTAGADCSQGSFALDVPPGTPYDQTQDVALAMGCNPAGGHVSAEFVVNGATIPLPPEPIP